MGQQASNGASATSQSAIATATTEIVTQLARSAAGELVKGQQPLSDVAKTIAGEAVQTLDKRGPELAEDAGIMNWRYAALGWITWQVGKRVVKRKAKNAVSRMTPGKQKRTTPAKSTKTQVSRAQGSKAQSTGSKQAEPATESGRSNG